MQKCRYNIAGNIYKRIVITDLRDILFLGGSEVQVSLIVFPWNKSYFLEEIGPGLGSHFGGELLLIPFNMSTDTQTHTKQWYS